MLAGDEPARLGRRGARAAGLPIPAGFGYVHLSPNRRPMIPMRIQRLKTMMMITTGHTDGEGSRTA